MTAVPGFRHDVFVSYAHLDNLPVAGAQVGFVSQLVGDLANEIGRKIGKSLDIWWDHYSLAGNTRVTEEIMTAAGHCASIVVIASPAYLMSEWCGRERSRFFELLSLNPNQARAVFIVAIEPMQQTALPPDLRDYRGYEFYRTVEDGRTTRPLRTEFSSDKETYYNRLSQLVQNVSDHLGALRSQARRPDGPEDQADPSKPCVLLLDVTDDLVQRRAELKDYLEQSGITVLPRRRYSRDDIDLYRSQMLADLERSRACVQIVGPFVGDRSDHERGMAWLRYEAIRDSKSKTPLVQWRDPDLDPGSIGDEDARALVSPASVRTDRFPDFRRAVADLALKPPARPAPRIAPNSVSVFVNADLLDRPLGVAVAQWLAAEGFTVLEPAQETEDAIEEWATNVEYCDSMMLVYGQSKPTWVRRQIMLSNKVTRKSPLKLLGVCIGPPRPEPARDKTADLAVRDSRIHYLRNEDSAQPDPAEMERFAARLRETQADV